MNTKILKALFDEAETLGFVKLQRVHQGGYKARLQLDIALPRHQWVSTEGPYSTPEGAMVDVIAKAEAFFEEETPERMRL